MCVCVRVLCSLMCMCWGLSRLCTHPAMKFECQGFVYARTDVLIHLYTLSFMYAPHGWWKDRVQESMHGLRGTGKGGRARGGTDKIWTVRDEGSGMALPLDVNKATETKSIDNLYYFSWFKLF